MNKEEIIQLLDKYHQGLCTTNEKAILESWYNVRATKNSHININDDLDLAKELIWTEVEKQLPGKNIPTKKIPFFTYKRIAVAASILLVIGLGLIFYKAILNHNASKDQDFGLAANKLKPGTNKAYLTLSNGQRITLTDAANGTIAQQAGIQITKTTNGQLVYTSGPNTSQARSLLNTVETPNAGQYQVTLPDGTNIWLNSASTLKYPVTFATQKTRTVQLTGEAYFEVTKDKNHPFIVKSPNQEVTVLGTHFNINSYADEPATKTTLLEGSVKVGDRVLKPGQQSTLKGRTLTITQADTEEAIAWKAGYFKFRDEPIQSIMRKISRWYDVTVVYEGEIPQKGLEGTMSRYQNVSKVLDMLQATKLVKFRIEGRTIIVTK